MKKFLIPLAAGVIVFGGVTAFAATLNVNSSSLGAGNAAVASCNAKAKVTYGSALVTADGTNKGLYVVTTAPVTTTDAAGGANTKCANMSYKVTLLDSTNTSLGEITGSLDASGTDTPDFTNAGVLASAVEGVSVVITG